MLEALKNWLDHYRTKKPEQGKIGKAVRIEINNNLIGNSIRSFALDPKIGYLHEAQEVLRQALPFTC